MEANKNGKGYTDEQWESLLCRTFGDPAPAPKAVESQKEPVAQMPPTPAPPAPPAPKQEVPVSETPKPETPKPETPKKAAPVPAKPAPKKKRKIWTLVWILLALSLVFAIVAVHVFPLEDDTDAITKEQRQCMKALRQWQSAQYYQLTTYTHKLGEQYHFSSSAMYKSPTEVETYCHGEDSTLYWCYNRDQNRCIGTVQKGDEWFTFSGNPLRSTEWFPTTITVPISEPWIMDYSLKDVQILHQDVQYEEVESQGKYTFITFAVMDTQKESPFYGQGPYHIQFSFQDDQLYSILILQTDTNDLDLIATFFNLYELSAEAADSLIQTQMTNPKQIPGLDFSSSTIPDATANTIPDVTIEWE